VALEEQALALVALGLLLEHPLRQRLGLLADLELGLLLRLGLGLLLQLGVVLGLGQAFRDVGALVLRAQERVAWAGADEKGKRLTRAGKLVGKKIIKERRSAKKEQVLGLQRCPGSAAKG
jgi:hypothetical protein